MDYAIEDTGCFRCVFRLFVYVSLSLLMGLQMYAYLWGSRDGLDGDISDVRYIVMQLTRGLTEVNRKHERLESEIELLTSTLPAMSAAAERARDSLLPTPSRARAGRQALDVKDYDRQIVDYALETAGGRVLDTGDTVDHVLYESPVSWALHALTSLVCRGCVGARAMIRPGTMPGECWAFKGARGEATLRLLGTVRLSGISIEHIPPDISPTREISSAPRLVQIEGLEYRGDPYPHDFGSYEYNKDEEPIQYFAVVHPASKGYSILRVRVQSNWGHPVYTCVYRLRVHGDLVPGQGAMQADEADLKIDNE
ncbi:hypothetical protein ACJJTC_011161 [Scirpophaga incertulas]